jgi:hypothetical protein
VGTGIDDLFFWLGAVVFFWSLLCAAALVALWGWRRSVIRARPPGGSATPAASNAPSLISQYTTLGTRTRVGYSSSSTEPGSLSAEEATRREQAWGNRYGELGDCGCNEAGSPGLPPRDAALDKGWGRDRDGNVIVWQD